MKYKRKYHLPTVTLRETTTSGLRWSQRPGNKQARATIVHSNGVRARNRSPTPEPIIPFLESTDRGKSSGPTTRATDVNETWYRTSSLNSRWLRWANEPHTKILISPISMHSPMTISSRSRPICGLVCLRKVPKSSGHASAGIGTPTAPTVQGLLSERRQDLSTRLLYERGGHRSTLIHTKTYCRH